MKKVGIIEEKPGVKSANRLMFIVGLLWLMAIISYGVIEKGWSPSDSSILFGSVAVILYGGKVAQKSMEKNSPGAEEPEKPAS